MGFALATRLADAGCDQADLADRDVVAGRRFDAPRPVSALVHQQVAALIGASMGDEDPGALLKQAAMGAGLALASEDLAVSDGLEPLDDLSTTPRSAR